MYIITTFGWEDRAATRIQIGCGTMAKTTQAYIEALGFKTKMGEGDEPNRSEAEVERAKRLMNRVAPLMFNAN